MKIFQSFGNAIRYLAEGVSRFFDGKDDYPVTGVQPYTGDYYSDIDFKRIER